MNPVTKTVLITKKLRALDIGPKLEHAIEVSGHSDFVALVDLKNETVVLLPRTRFLADFDIKPSSEPDVYGRPDWASCPSSEVVSPGVIENTLIPAASAPQGNSVWVAVYKKFAGGGKAEAFTRLTFAHLKFAGAA